ncbi:craniofacial development protein 1 [Dunckerocampus dactyliophorus]|uniref:craniofacial development protein 1 n=1 Tax=Dunckerocampus dactyliophorus TaxID=161453 RepID=UPI0024063311|nr:craniofacial development protein 1 [Dunckerocampus dactyliophorus]
MRCTESWYPLCSFIFRQAEVLLCKLNVTYSPRIFFTHILYVTSLIDFCQRGLCLKSEMNCFDDDDGSSSSEDADYLPSDDNLSEDDIDECEKEDLLDESDVPHPDSSTRKRTKKRDSSMRSYKNRTKRVHKVDQEENGGGAKEAEPRQEGVQKLTQIKKNEEDTQKKQSDDLWARFLFDVGSRPNAATSAAESHTPPEADSSASSACITTETQATDPSTVTIIKVFDFAGEEIRLNKEVLADSREAKMHLKSQCTKEETKDKENPTSPTQSDCPGPSTKQPVGLSSVLSRFGGKKQKLSTLEKSKMDWDAFKSEEGITEELAIHNRGRDGYVERKNFLERVDHRQFEMEKAVRLKNMKPSS